MSANLDIMAGDLSKFNELFYEDPLILKLRIITGHMVIYFNSR